MGADRRYFSIDVRWHDDRFHGRGDGGKPEWPPSPLRLMAALVAGGSPLGDAEHAALRWLESAQPPTILAPDVQCADGVLSYVPSNNRDAGKAVDVAGIRTEKLIRPQRLPTGSAVSFVWDVGPDDVPHAQTLTRLAGKLRCLGWGIDMAFAHARLTDEPPAADGRQTYRPATPSRVTLRLPEPGTLASMDAAHEAALGRVIGRKSNEVHDRPGLLRFRRVGYKPGAAPPAWLAFALRDADGEFVTFGPDRIAPLAGMVRHLLGEAAASAGIAEDWVAESVMGHDRGLGVGRTRVLPLPTIGHPHADGLVRRLIVQLPSADDADALRQRLAGRALQPDGGPALDARLEPIRETGPMLDRFTQPATQWASTTAVLLPGFDGPRGKANQTTRAAKADKLIRKACRYAGLPAPTDLALSRVSFHRGIPSARAFSPRQKLRHYPRYHVRLRFDQPISGPVALGAGAPTGFGVLAHANTIRRRK